MKKIVIILFVLLKGFVFSQQNGVYKSLLWKISGNGIKKEGYLYGTMHVSKRVAFRLSDNFITALNNSDVVGLETNPAEWLKNMEDIGELSKNSGASLYNPNGNNFYKSVFGLKFPATDIYQTLLRFDPEIINALLYRSSANSENFEESTYIDLFIFQAAAKLNKQIVSLEDFRKAEIQSKLAEIPDAEFSKSKTDEIDYTGTDLSKYAEQIEDAYRVGDLNAIDSISTLTDSKNMRQFLLNNRNEFFVHHIDSILKSGKSLFSGVGAAHLPGEKGVIELLRRLNYIVEPIYPEKYKKASKFIEKIDKTIKPVVFKTQFSEDSLFNLQIPGNLTQLMNYDNIKYYVCADMVNGNFYTVARLKTNGVLNGISVQRMILKVDSLLFENVPGKILTKKEIVNNGNKGFDLVIKTRQGDLQRYQIFATEIELILFKLGGKADYVNSNDGKQFFNSIKLVYKATNRTQFQPKTKGFKVTIPNQFDYNKNDYVGVSGLVEDLSAFDRNTSTYYGVKHAVYNDFYYLEEDTFELNRFASYTLQNFDFKINSTFNLIKDKNLPCIQFEASGKSNLKFNGKIFIKGVHYYLVFAIGENKNGFNDEFFKSFTLTDFEYLNKIDFITDPDMHFKTKDETSDTPMGRFNSDLAKAYKAIKDSVKSYTDKNEDFDYYSRVKNYYSPSSHEYVEIFYERHNKYDYRNKDSLIKTIHRNIGEMQTMKVVPIKTAERNGELHHEFYLTDTATVRAIKVKVLVKNSTVYQVKVPLDTLIGLSGWAKSFFENFELKDTIIGNDIFKNKFSLLLKDLVSTDTLIRKQANQSITSSIGMEPLYLNDFIAFLKSPDVLKLNTTTKAQLFVNGGILKSDKIIEVYKKLYESNIDSTYIQICLLKGLAYRKSKNSFNAFMDLILSETPLVGDVDMVKDVFKVMADSLELCAPLFPRILALTRYAEYHEPVYKLLALLIKHNIIPAKAILESNSNVLVDANNELKRFVSGISGKSASSTYGSLLNKSSTEVNTMEFIRDAIADMNTNYFLKSAVIRDRVKSEKQPLLISFVNILAPLYSADRQARAFIDKVSNLKNESTIIPIYLSLLNNQIIMNDTIAGYLSKNTITASYFYSELENMNRITRFDSSVLTQKYIVESYLSLYSKLVHYNNYESEVASDSLLFQNKYPVKNKYETGHLYVYKTAKNKFGIAKWSSAFVAGTINSKITSNVLPISVNILYNETKTDKEIINEMIDDFSNSYRSRISPISNPTYE